MDIPLYPRIPGKALEEAQRKWPAEKFVVVYPEDEFREVSRDSSTSAEDNKSE